MLDVDPAALREAMTELAAHLGLDPADVADVEDHQAQVEKLAAQLVTKLQAPPDIAGWTAEELLAHAPASVVTKADVDRVSAAIEMHGGELPDAEAVPAYRRTLVQGLALARNVKMQTWDDYPPW